MPKEYERMFNEKVIYCKITKTLFAGNNKVYLVKYLQNGKVNMFTDDELKKLSLIDRFKILKYRGK